MQRMSRGTTINLFDSHCHLDLRRKFAADSTEVMARAVRGAGWICRTRHRSGAASPGAGLASTIEALYVAVGIHPNSADQFDAATLDELRRLAEHPKVVAIGEIGLDFYWKTVAPEVQHTAFACQLPPGRRTRPARDHPQPRKRTTP